MASRKTVRAAAEQPSPVTNRQVRSTAAAMAPRPLALAVPLALAASLVVTAGCSAAAHAQAAEGQTGSAPEAQAQAGDVRQYDIPAGPLSEVLTRFSTESGIFLGGATDLAEGKRSPGLQGHYSVEQALRTLLSSSGLSYRFAGEDRVTLVATQEGDGPTRLGPVTVTASRFETPVSLLPKSVTVLEEGSIEAQPSFDHNLNAGLSKTVPGVSFADSIGNTPRIRGRNASVRINGVEVNDTIFSFSSPQQSIASSSLERVEVVRGSDATFGFGASGGAINYITRRPTPGPLQLEAYVELDFQDEDIEESFGERAGISATGSKGAFEYAVGADARFSNTLFDPDGNPLPDAFRLGQSNSDTYSGDAAFAYNIDENQRIETTHTGFFRDRDPEFTVTFVDPGDVSEGVPTPVIPVSEAPTAAGLEDPEETQYVGTLTYKHADILGSRAEVTAYYQHLDFIQDPFAFSDDFVTNVSVESSKIGARLNFATPLTVLDSTFFADSSVQYGFDYERFDREDGFIGGEQDGLEARPNSIEDSYAPWLQLKLALGERFLLDVGARYEDTDIDLESIAAEDRESGQPFEGGTVSFDQTLFNASLLYFLSDHMETYFSLSEAADVSDIGRATTSFTSADAFDPDPAKTQQFELGWRGSWDRWQFTSAVFYSDSDLGTRIIPGSPVGIVLREPRDLWGFELTGDLQWTDQWGFGGTLSFSDGETKPEDLGSATDLGCRDRQPLKATAYAEYRPTSAWTTRLSGVHQLDCGGNEDLGQSGSDSLTFVDAHIARKIGDGRLSLAVENLLDEDTFGVIEQVFDADTNAFKFPGRRFVLRYAHRF